jgi:hypothetical protein
VGTRAFSSSNQLKTTWRRSPVAFGSGQSGVRPLPHSIAINNLAKSTLI